MKRQLLASVIAGLGVVGSAHAVHVNPDGLGQVLLYPYYSVQDGYDTYVHVVNTTTAAKAVKVRFLEGKNSQEVLDFNLYLSPKDEWTAVITRTETGAQLATTDTSCTAPAIPAGGVAFRNFEYNGDAVSTLERTREGYLEIIEMGDLSGAVAAAATHTSAGVPADCAAVRADASTASGTLPASGGLYGFNTLINVEAGLSTTVDAVALDDFWLNNQGSYTTTGSLSPSLEDGTPVADIIDGDQVITAFFAQRVDAVSAVLSRTNVMNDYVVGLDFNALTDWVVTFPTKRFYVNGDAAPRRPFSQEWDGSQSCDNISITYYDREEQREVGEDDFSPQPDAAEAALCNEVNTVSIVANGEEGGLLGANYTAAQIELAPGFNAGWMDIGFNSVPATVGLVSANGIRVAGLPVIGFSAMSFTNSTLEVDGVNVLSNYGGTSVHKGQRSITAVAPQ